MEAPRHFFEALIFFLTSYMADPTHYIHINRSKVIEKMIAAHETYDPIHYHAQLRFKGFESDTFDDTRGCLISYKSNTGNPLYGYDWKYEESFGEGKRLMIMVTPEGEYYIAHDDTSKIIHHRPLKNQIEPGTYTETMRGYFLGDQVLDPYISTPPEELTMIDSSGYYILSVNPSETSTQKLAISKESFLPIRTIEYHQDPDFDLLQITDIQFTYFPFHKTLSDSVFSIDYYRQEGYEYKFIEPASPIEEEKLNLTHAQFQLLMNYPFISAQQDTARIANLDAQYILLDFWYASCAPCLKALPELNSLSETYQDSILSVIGINCFDKKNRQGLTEKLRAKDIRFPLLFGDRGLIDSLGISAFPAYFLMTPDRKIEYIDGGVADVKKILQQHLEK